MLTTVVVDDVGVVGVHGTRGMRQTCLHEHKQGDHTFANLHEERARKHQTEVQKETNLHGDRISCTTRQNDSQLAKHPLV